MSWINPYTLQVLGFLVLNLLLALSIYITLATGQLSLGQAGFMSIGAYTAAILGQSFHFPFLLSLLLGALLAGAVALLIGLPTLRLQGLYLAIATLGFGEVVRVIMINLEITHGALGINGLTSIGTWSQEILKNIGWTAQNMGVSTQMYKSILTLLFLLFLFFLFLSFTLLLTHSKMGRAFHAIKADEIAALAMGIPITRYKMLAFVLGAMLAGLGGGLYAHMTTSITPDDFSYHRAVEILSFAVIGGVEVVAGPLLGAAFLTAIPEFLRGLSEYKMLFYGGTMLLVMAFRPRGILTDEGIGLFRKRKEGVRRDSVEMEEVR
ncbi:MAG: branched-chain amino acid ABC transporter permease [Thermicanus sp.]|nr:branched-chain amino acid ABC transporter permease [Thermicanus sp.]